MGKIPPIVIVIIGLVLIIGSSVALFFLVIKPRQATMAQEKTAYEAAWNEAQQLPAARAAFEQVLADWERVQVDLKGLQNRRGVPISYYTNLPAWIRSWQELRVDLPKAVEDFVGASGLQIQGSASFPSPAGSPPPPPQTGFMDGGSISLTVTGSLTELEKFYGSLNKFKRVMTISGFNLSGSGDQITAPVTLTFYLLVEVPPTTAPAASAAGSPGAPGVGLGGPPGPPVGAAAGRGPATAAAGGVAPDLGSEQ